MRTAIALSLSWPERIDTPVARLDLEKLATLTFEAPDRQRFPCLALAEAAMASGGLAPAILNAANEIAVDAFLEGRLTFPGIAAAVDATLDAAGRGGHLQGAGSLGAALAADATGRRLAREVIEKFNSA
jgi:1-deoxy-D-xylulose-5-phosphate reductoisomerase